MKAEKIAEHFSNPALILQISKALSKGERIEIYAVKDEVKVLEVSKRLMDTNRIDSA